jgi:hypothetical protein
MKMAWRYIARFSLAWLCSFVYLLAIYFPAASIPFAHQDQYRYFIAYGRNNEAVKQSRDGDTQGDWLRLIGRPVAAELEYQIYKRVNTVSDLTAVRVFGIGLFAAAMAMFFCYLCEFRLTAASAFCLAGAVFALPGVQFSVCMASYNHPVAHILALASALFMRLGSRLAAGKKHWYLDYRLIACYTLSVVLLVVAQLSYPPSSFVVLFLIGAEIALQGTAEWATTRRHLIRDTALLVLACVVYYLIIKHYYDSQGGHPHLGYQIEMNLDLADRLRGFVELLLWPMFNLWNVHVSTRLGVAVAGFLVSGLGVMFCRQLRPARRIPRQMLPAASQASTTRASVRWAKPLRRLGRGLQLIVAIGGVLVLSETTFIAAQVRWTLYRTHFASAGITVLLLAGAVMCWSRLLAPRWRSKAAAVLAWGMLCGAGFVAHGNVLMNSLNDRLELSFIGSQIAAHAGEPISRIHVIQAVNESFTFNGREIVLSGDEFNVPSTRQPGFIGTAVRTALQTVFQRDSFRICDVAHTIAGIQSADSQAITITYSAHGEPVLPSPHTVVIDMDALLRIEAPTKRPWAPPLTTASAPGSQAAR